MWLEKITVGDLAPDLTIILDVAPETGLKRVTERRGDAAADRFEAEGRAVVRFHRRNLYFGGVSAVEVLADGSLAAAGDPRRGGAGVVIP